MNSIHKEPKASVILPVYNAGQYLDAAIESVLEQSFTDFELLLLDDGSSDGSRERLEHYATLDSRCRVYSWSNKGLIETLNTGIRLSCSDILIRMDQDDICYPERFEKQLAYLNTNPSLVAVGSRVMLIDPEGLPICPFPNAISHEEIDSAHLAKKGGAIPHPTVVMRKSAVVKVGCYRDEFPHAEDIDLFLRLAEIGQVANLPEILLDYRQHLNSTGSLYRETQKNSGRKAVADAVKRRKLSKQPLPHNSDSNTHSQKIRAADIHRKWGWWALSARNVKTARKHAFMAIRKKPISVDNLKLLFCVLRGY